MRKDDLFDAIIRKDFLSFLQKSFYTINPSGNFYNNWHINLISDYLAEVEKNNIKRLIINIPPRNLKSICISVAWPAWILAHMPEKKIIATSYSLQLSVKHSIDCKMIISSSWYKKIFPNTKISKNLNTKSKFLTSKNGFRMSTSVGGSLTGEGADILIVDDPHNPTYIKSKKIREKVTSWYENTFLTRLNNPQQGKIVIVMQRLHEEDLCGNLIKRSGDWKILKIPAISMQDTKYFVSSNIYNFYKGNSINEKHCSIDYLYKLREEIGDAVFLSQYQQKPTSSLCYIKKEHIQFYQEENDIKYHEIIQSWDTAFKVSYRNDFSVCTTWGIVKGNFYLLDCYKGKLVYPSLKEKVLYLKNKFCPDKILIEDHANGQSLIQDLKSLEIYNVIGINHRRSKHMRFDIMLSFFFNKKVFFPKEKEFLRSGNVDELLNFPNVDYDDFVDSCSQFFSYINDEKKRTKNVKIRTI